ncbi:MAG: radical SAM protein [Candidatus Margulisbacteria bacterium GWF2_38_17]|nr:MAG: radical SAM protein [Candidatus Margulisbacteria bacterium GWF2_38_17]
MLQKNNLHASVILTYRCNAKCNMCNVYKYPSNKEEEIGPKELEKLPQMKFTNITGGEPFVRNDIENIVAILRKKTKRIVISTNGYFTDRIVNLCKKHPDLGIRISIEGMPKTNDAIRGIPDGFDKGLRTLLTLREMGITDIGFGMTVQEVNAQDLIPLYSLANALGYEFATATLHNSHYFHKYDNRIINKEKVTNEFEKLIACLLTSRSPKKWFRAYFNNGLINFIHGGSRPIPCNMGSDGFFLDPSGDILPCNGMDRKLPMGNIKRKSFDEIWTSQNARNIRETVKRCNKQCWMIGSAAPAMKNNMRLPISWILKNKIFGYRGYKKTDFQQPENNTVFTSIDSAAKERTPL